MTELESYNPSSFNEGFIKAFKQTRAFAIWDKNTDEVIFDLVEPKYVLVDFRITRFAQALIRDPVERRHPMEGKTNPFEDVGIRLVSGLHDLHLPENLGPTKEAIQRGFVSGSEGIWGAVKWAREEATKRQKELQVNLAAQQAAREKEGGENKGGKEPPKEVGEYLAGGVDVASKGAASVAAGLGGLWGKARNSTLFAPSPITSNNPSPNPNRPNSNPSLSPSDLPLQARPPSPTPSTISTTSSNKSSSLVTVQAGLTTPPNHSNPTFPGEKRGGLRTLSTAIAASPAQPSSSTSSSNSPQSTSTSTSSGGFSSFFGGIRRSFIDQPQPTSTPPSNPSLSLPSLSSLGWGNSSSSRTRSSSSTPTLSPSLLPNPHRRSSTVPLSSVGSDDDDEEEEEVIVVKDLDGMKGEEEVVVLKIRDLDRERERESGREDARRKLEGV